MTASEERTISEFVDGVGKYLVGALEPVFRTTLEKEITTALEKALKDGQFYKYVSSDLQKGIADLFKQINNFKKEAGEGVEMSPPDTHRAEQALSEASSQLDYIFKSTEEAATNILNIVEKNMAVQDEVMALLQETGANSPGNASVDRLKALNKGIQNDYIEVMTALSFQDLTGQRIKKVIDMLSFIEEAIVRMLVSTGMKIKEKEACPDKDVEQIITEAEAMADTALKGPQADANQVDIDNLLSELGL